MFVYDCPRLLNPVRPMKRVRLEKYAGLHPEGKQLINGWFQRAWAEVANGGDEVFERFIFAWFSFNGWAACVTDTDRDAELITALAADAKMYRDFDVLLSRPNSTLKLHAKQFAELLPIFDVKTLRRSRLFYAGFENRRQGIEAYLNEGITAFEPKCWKRHKDAGEDMPLDWPHILKPMYKVRCNLFHGQKSAHSEMDRLIVSSAFLTLIHFVKEGGYL